MEAKMAIMSKAAASSKRKALKKQGKSGIVIRNPGKFGAWCKAHGFGGVNARCIAAGLKAGGSAAKMANFARSARTKFNK
jgi:hypothetical protein